MRFQFVLLASFLPVYFGGGGEVQTSLPAAPARQRAETVNGWTVRDEGGWCSAATVQSPDIHIRLIHDIPASWAQLFVWNRAWRWMGEGQQYEVALNYSNGRAHRDMNARGVHFITPRGGHIDGLAMTFRGADALDDFARAAVVELQAGNRQLGSLSLRGTGALVRRLTTCASESARRNPAVSMRRAIAVASEVEIARPPIHHTGTIFNDDYPIAAIRAREQGTVSIEMEVGADGIVASCAVLQSSSSAALDTTSCAIARRRFYFTPAVDANGRNAAAIATRTIIWVLPGSNLEPPDNSE